MQQWGKIVDENELQNWNVLMRRNAATQVLPLVHRVEVLMGLYKDGIQPRCKLLVQLPLLLPYQTTLLTS